MRPKERTSSQDCVPAQCNRPEAKGREELSNVSVNFPNNTKYNSGKAFYISDVATMSYFFSSFQNVDLSFEITFDFLFKVLDETEKKTPENHKQKPKIKG